MNEPKSIISTIISEYERWDEAGGDYGDIQFYNAKLAIDTKKFKKGDVVKCVTFMFSESVCQLWTDGKKEPDGFTPTEVLEEFQIKLSYSIV